MTTQIAVRLDDAELAALDAEVAAGRAANRSDAVRRSIARMQRDWQRRVEDASYAAYDGHPLTEPDEWGDLASFREAVARS